MTIIKYKIKSLSKKAVNQVSISATDLGEININIPKYKEQLAISFILKNLDIQYNLYNEAQNNIIQLKEALKQVLFSGKIRFELKEDGLQRIGDRREANN